MRVSVEEVVPGTVSRRRQEIVAVEEVEGCTVEVMVHIGEALAVVIDRTLDIGHTGEEEGHYGTVEAFAEGSSLRCRGACTHCTLALREHTAGADVDADGYVGADVGVDLDCIVVGVPYLAALPALPADDDHSSCRRGSLVPNRARAASVGSYARLTPAV